MPEQRRNTGERKVENLELNRETVADLAEGEAEQARGGVLLKGQDLQAYTRLGPTCICPEPG